MRAVADITAEHSTRPARVVIHDPTAFGALGPLLKADDIERDMLFREPPDVDLYSAQHERLAAALGETGVEVLRLDTLLPSDEIERRLGASPNQVFTRDSAVTLPWAPSRFLACAMLRPVRAQEPATMAAALTALGLSPLLRLPEGAVLEGGDVVPFGYDGKRVLLIGHGPRSNRAAIEHLRAALIPEWLDEIVALELGPWRLNLDGGMLPVSRDIAIAHLPSLLKTHVIGRDEVREVDFAPFMRSLGYRIVEVSYEESWYLQACNCFCAGEGRVVMYDLCPRVADALRDAGLEVVAVPGSELVKGRGGPRCMTRPLYF